MSAEDFRINAYVRQVLSRCWVNLQAVRYGAVGEVVYFHGRFEKIRAPEPAAARESGFRSTQIEHIAEDLGLLETVEKEIRREPRVRDVVFRLDNFRKVKGKWTTTGVS